MTYQKPVLFRLKKMNCQNKAGQLHVPFHVQLCIRLNLNCVYNRKVKVLHFSPLTYYVK